MALNAKVLAKILAEEFNGDSYGDIDPYWFELIADEDTAALEDEEQEVQVEVRSLEKLLERVCDKLEKL